MYIVRCSLLKTYLAMYGAQQNNKMVSKIQNGIINFNAFK